MIDQHTGEQYFSRDLRYKFRVAVAKSVDKGYFWLSYHSRRESKSPKAKCYALNDVGAVLLDRSMLPRSPAGSKTVTMKMAARAKPAVI
eukprot:237792-Amphidinium_carterae.1